MKAIILAGGVGSRLWPMSRENKPKQFFNIVSDKPLIRDTYNRLIDLFPPSNIYFLVPPSYVSFINDLFPETDDKHILTEPEKRDTCPAMGYTSALMELSDPDEPIVFVPSDHYICEEKLFLKTLQIGGSLVQKTGKLLDIAITPTYPSTGLGYTRIGDLYDIIDGISVYYFAGHVEKPRYEKAKQYIEDGSYLWHASYYMWTPRAFMKAFEQYAPEIWRELIAIQKGKTERFSYLPKISFDYAVTEKMNTEDVLIMKGDFGWSDIGAWDTLYDYLARHGENIIKGKCEVIDTNGSLIYAPNNKTVAVLGMNNVVVVDTGDALLVCPKSRAQDVKLIIGRFAKDNNSSIV